MPLVETDTKTILDHLRRDGWTNIDGRKHDNFVHAERPGMRIMVPRHRTLTEGVARSIAKAACSI